jgi:hypothetical protein
MRAFHPYAPNVRETLPYRASLERVIRFTLYERRTAPRGGLGSIKHRPGGPPTLPPPVECCPEVPP